MKKSKNKRFGYYRVALCRGLGFMKITEEEFNEAFKSIPLDCRCYLMKGRYFVFVCSVVHVTSLTHCTDDYIYIRKEYR